MLRARPRPVPGATCPSRRGLRGRGTRSRCVACFVRAPTSTSPGSASCWSRAATLTASPVTISSTRAASLPAMTSPVSMPIRRPTSPPCAARTFAAKPLEAPVHRERGPHGSLRVVLVCPRNAEPRQDRVADELLGEPAVASHFGVDELVEPALQQTDVLGVEALPQRRRAGEVGEERAHDPPFLPVGGTGSAPRPRPQGRAARRAERRRCELLLAANRTVEHLGDAAGGQNRLPVGTTAEHA